MQRALIGAKCESSDWADLVWREGLSPLLDAGASLDQIVWDAKYDIAVDVGRQESDGVLFHRVETLSRARRVLPYVRPRRYWVSAARTSEALITEYSAPNCLTRELVIIPEVEPSQWRAKVVAACQVRIAIDGSNLPVYVDPTEGLLDIVRWYFEVPADEWIGVVVPFSLQFDFFIPTADRTFPVFFNSYYSAGTTEISLRLKNVDQDHKLSCLMFVAHGLAGHAGDLVESATSDSQFVMFSTPRLSLLWPGSGILFQW